MEIKPCKRCEALLDVESALRRIIAAQQDVEDHRDSASTVYVYRLMTAYQNGLIALIALDSGEKDKP